MTYCLIAALTGCTASRTNGQYTTPTAAFPTAVTQSAPIPLQPVKIETAKLPTGVFHTVKKGDTLFDISKKYSVPVASIVKSNNIRNQHKIREGDQLFIPGVYSDKSATLFRDIPLYRETGKWLYIIVHHTATLDGDKNSIERLHKRRGFGEMGYHFLIDNGTLKHMDGEIEVGSRWYDQKDGAHAKDSNMNVMGIGICLVGNFSSQRQVSPNQLASLSYLVNILRSHYKIPKSKILRHLDVPGAATECPGKHFPWKRFFKTLN